MIITTLIETTLKRPNTILKNLQTNRSYFKKITNSFRNYEPKQLEPPYNHVTQIGDPVLRKSAYPIPEDYIQSKEINVIIDQMIKVLQKYDCVGLAAPQIGISLQIIVMEFSDNLKKEFTSTLYKNRQMETLPLTVFINPEIKVINYNKKTFEESCASVKGYSGEVDRYEEILLNGFNAKGDKQNLLLKGWNARIAQHEMDHLNGQIYIDIMNPKTFTCTCWETVNLKCGKIELPYYK